MKLFSKAVMNNQPNLISGNPFTSSGFLENKRSLVTTWNHQYYLPTILLHMLVHKGKEEHYMIYL